MPTNAILTLVAILMLTGCMFAHGDMPPIIGAARNGDVHRLEELLNAGANPNVRAGVNDWTPLMHAVHKNQPRSVEVLLKHGALPNERGGGGSTALIMAAGYGFSGMVRTLLDAGADPTLKARNGDDALTAAVGGVGDIDRFTVGHCQTETVRTLMAAAPNLRLAGNSDALRIARFRGCSEVLALAQAKPAR